MLQERKSKSKKFRIRWSKVPRVLEPSKSSYGRFSHKAGHGRFKPKNTQNGNKSRFPGATCIFSKCCKRQKRRARNSASDGPKVPCVLEPLKSRYGHFCQPAGHGRFKPKKHPKWQEIAISRGYVHFQQMLRETKTKSKKFRIRWSKSTARFGATKIELWPF